MKIQNFIVIKLLLLQVLFCTSANTFAYSSETPDLDSKTGSFFQQDQNDKALLIEENLRGSELRISSERELDVSHISYGVFKIAITEPDNSGKSSTYDFQQDQKSLLKTQIFPFHAFW